MLVRLNEKWPTCETVRHCSLFSKFKQGKATAVFNEAGYIRPGVFSVSFPNGKREEFAGECLSRDRQQDVLDAVKDALR